MPRDGAWVSGRSSQIRTDDPLLPKQMRYRAALYSEPAIIPPAVARAMNVGRAGSLFLLSRAQFPFFRLSSRTVAAAVRPGLAASRQRHVRITRRRDRHDNRLRRRRAGSGRRDLGGVRSPGFPGTFHRGFLTAASLAGRHCDKKNSRMAAGK